MLLLYKANKNMKTKKQLFSNANALLKLKMCALKVPLGVGS